MKKPTMAIGLGRGVPKNWARLIQKIGASAGLDPGKRILYRLPSAREHEHCILYRGRAKY